MLGCLAGLGGETSTAADPSWWLVVPCFAVAHLIMNGGRVPARLARLPDWAYATCYGMAVALALPFAATGYQAFIYFQF